MYARTTEIGELTLAVSGKLWEMSLVMVDEETNSLWSHLLGRAMQGPLEGTQLEVIPSVITDWQTWKSRYPGTMVLAAARTASGYNRSLHLDADDLLIGLAGAEDARAWRLNDLRAQSIVNDRFAGRPILVLHAPNTGTMVIHGRSVSDRELHFAVTDGELLDRQTNSQWDMLTGVALTGPLQGQRLPSERAIVSNDYGWSVFHPESTYWDGGEEQQLIDDQPEVP